MCGGLGAESVYSYDLAAEAALIISTDHPGTTVDTVVYVRETCRDPATELGCNDDAPGAISHGSTLILPDVHPSLLLIIVDTYGATSAGDFQLTVDRKSANGASCDPTAPSPCLPEHVCRPLLPGDPPTCEVHECQDTLDNDGDGAIDYPNDSGCTTPTDDTELIAAGDPIPQCGNGVDDDGDGLIDYSADPGCAAASDDLELDECVPGLIVQGVLVPGGVTGALSGSGMSFLSGSCDSSSMFSDEQVWAYTVAQPLVDLRFSTIGSTADTILYVHQGECATGMEVACASVPSAGEVAILPSPAAATYFVIVDSAFSAGPYVLDVFGDLPHGATCDPADTHFTCLPGTLCGAGGTCDFTACTNGVDDDGDGLIDANDPGCADSTDNDETDPATSPQCGNAIDDDADGHIDFPADPGCARAGDPTELDCSDMDPTVNITHLQTSMGDTTTAHDDSTPSCGFTMAGNDVVAEITVPGAMETLAFDTLGSTVDTVLTIHSGECGNPELACNDDVSGGATTDSQITLSGVAAGTYYAIVDSNWGGAGAYDLHVTGIVADDAPCDPLQVVPGFFSCNPGRTCIDLGTGPRCQ
jgi:hypothetical protein